MSVSNLEILTRRYMWIGHGCPKRFLYGDDGEMQCHHCGLDFKRSDILWLDDRIRDNLLYAAARETCHSMGFPWTDPRTGKLYPPPTLLALVKRLEAEATHDELRGWTQRTTKASEV